MNGKVRTQLSVMMFLQFFIWGAWIVTLGTYLGMGLKFGGDAIGKAYSTMPWGAILAPFIVGMIADRFFSAQKVMGILHLVGGVVMFYATSVTSPMLFFWVVLLYAICYNPTLALVNAISFNQMDSPEKQFPAIRVFGTLGWIVAGLIIGFMKVEDTAIPMKIAAVASILLGVYSFFLPNTPPKSLGHKVKIGDVLGLEALKLMKDRSFFIFVLGSLLICIPLGFYYNFTNLFLNDQEIGNAAGKMTIGQMSEVLFMLVMPFLFVRLGVKKMLLIGMLAWFVRYLCFAYGSNDAISMPITADGLLGSLAMVLLFYIGIAIHGICYDFFFVTGQIYVDNKAPKAIQASAQGFIALVTYGVGMVIGARISGWIVEKYQLMEGGTIAGYDWQTIWKIPALMAIVVIVLFALFFKDNKKTQKALETDGAAA